MQEIERNQGHSALMSSPRSDRKVVSPNVSTLARVVSIPHQAMDGSSAVKSCLFQQG